MRLVRVVDSTRKSVLGGRVRVADDFLSRTFGLLGQPAPAPGEGLLLSPCRAVHMIGMRYPLDVAFLDRKGVILAVHHALPPGLRIRWQRSAMHTLELPAGTLKAGAAEVGDLVSWLPVDQPQEDGAENGSTRRADATGGRIRNGEERLASLVEPLNQKESV